MTETAVNTEDANANATSLERTLGDLVAERPARARVLERVGIDYCCHGQRTLADAASEAGVPLADLAQELFAVDDMTGTEVDGLEPLALVDHLVSTHHAYLRSELPALQTLADKVRDVHGCRHAELTEVAHLVTLLTTSLLPHLDEEETEVFPQIIRQLDTTRVADSAEPAIALGLLRADHEQVGALLQQLRAAATGYRVPADGCASYHGLYARLTDLEADTFRHVHLENNVLFPQVFVPSTS